MEHYDLEVCGLKRELPFVKLSDGTAYASFVVISDTELIEKAGKELAAFANGAEIILTIEAKGIALAYEISKQLHMKEFVVVRKSVKSYVNHLSRMRCIPLQQREIRTFFWMKRMQRS